MGSQRLDRHYDQLGPQERFQLAIGAMARGDQRETQRLQKSCPRQSYRQMDAACVGRIDSSRVVAMAWGMLWEEAYRDWMVFCVADPAWRVTVAADGPQMTVLPLIGRLLSLFLGLAWFCDSVGCDPVELLRAWWPPLADRVAAFLEADFFRLLDGGSEDAGALSTRVLSEGADVEELLSEAWPFSRTSATAEDGGYESIGAEGHAGGGFWEGKAPSAGAE
jgi:hypothetical protein